MEDLHKAVAANATFKSADAKLTKCAPMADAATSGAIAIPRTSLDGVLENYTATFRTGLETNGTCEEDLIAALNTLHTVSKLELAKLKASDLEYAQILNTPHGKDFEESVGDPDEILRYALLLASASEFAQARGQDAPISPPAPEPAPKTGVNCLLSSEAADTEQKKVDVLNCLVLDTPHNFWVRQAQVAHGPDEKNDLQKLSQYDFLGYEGWDCSKWFDGPVPSCLKHDVSWATLRKVVGGLEDDTLDIAWNPRNKYASDEQFFFDIKAHDCQSPSILARETWCYLPGFIQAGVMQFAVRHLNDKGWVYTQEDREHVIANPKYTLCSPPVPNVGTLRLTQQSEGIYAVSWQFEKGCVTSLAVHYYKVNWWITYTGNSYGTSASIEIDGESLSAQLNLSSTLPGIPAGSVQSVAVYSMEIVPKNRTFGAHSHIQNFTDLSWTK